MGLLLGDASGFVVNARGRCFEAARVLLGVVTTEEKLATAWKYRSYKCLGATTITSIHKCKWGDSQLFGHYSTPLSVYGNIKPGFEHSRSVIEIFGRVADHFTTRITVSSQS